MFLNDERREWIRAYIRENFQTQTYDQIRRGIYAEYGETCGHELVRRYARKMGLEKRVGGRKKGGEYRISDAAIERMKKKKTLCWSCQMPTFPDGYPPCPWFHRHKPVPGWVADREDVPVNGKQRQSFRVYQCPLFLADDRQVEEDGTGDYFRNAE